MPNQPVLAPSGRELFLVTNKTTTATTSDEIKKILVKRETVEVIVSDSRLISRGSQFGHVAIDIDGSVYGRAHDAWDVAERDSYLERQQVKMHRDSWGFILIVSKNEKGKILAEIKKRVAANKPYTLDDNSCSSNIAEVLEFSGIPSVFDARFSIGAISPADLITGLSHSKRLIKKVEYSKK